MQRPLCFVSSQTSEGPKCDVGQPNPHRSPETCGRNKYVTFLLTPEQTSHPVTHFYAKTPSPLTHTSSETIVTVHTPMSQEGIILCAWPVLCIVLCCTSLPLLTRMHKHIHNSATEPLSFLSNHFFFFFLLNLADQDLCKRDLDPDPPPAAPPCKTLQHRMPVWSLSASFFMCSFLFVRSKLLFIISTVGLHLSRTAHNFSLHS